MTLLSLSITSLKTMIDICYKLSCLLRYQYNSNKCAVVTFNESKLVYKRSSRSWVMGNDIIYEKEEYDHLGIVCNKYVDYSILTKHIDKKIRGTLFGLIKEGLYVNGLNPLTSYSF